MFASFDSPGAEPAVRALLEVQVVEIECDVAMCHRRHGHDALLARLEPFEQEI